MKLRRDFQRVIDSGRLSKNESFVLYYLPAYYSGFRIGICVGKSLGSAVVRNRLKRQIRESIRRLDFDLENIDIVLIARKSITGTDFSRIYEGLKKVFSKVIL